jgi:hypothetical protein
MQRLEVSGAVRPIYGSLGVKRLRDFRIRETGTGQQVAQLHVKYMMMMMMITMMMKSLIYQICLLMTINESSILYNCMKYETGAFFSPEF